MSFVLPPLLIRVLVPPEVQCRADGGTPSWDENGDFVCKFQDDSDENKPFYREPTDEHNVPRPRPNGERGDDTDEETEQPEPKPLPNPSPPPVTFDDNTGNRRPVPNPPITDPPETPPNVPTRRLPSSEDFDTVSSTPPSITLEKKLQSVKDDALSRVYGCMLHSPITSSPAIFRVCEAPDDSEETDERIKKDSKDFFEFLIRKLRDTATEESLTAVCVLSMNLLPSNFLRYLPQGQLLTVFGCSYLSEIASEFLFSSNNAYQSVDGQGHINVKYIECNPEEDGSGDFTKGLQPQKQNLNECFVPIRNFKTNEPEQLGMKMQLQIVYELVEEIDNTDPVEYKTWNKQITIPSPQEDLSTDDIKDVFPETLKFGEIKAEFSVEPYGYVRFYTDEDDYDNGNTDDLFDDIIDNLINGDEKTDSRRFSKRTRNLKTGEFTRKKAFLYKWESDNGKPPLCKVYNLV